MLARAVKLSTDDLPARDRFAIWREVYGQHLFNLEIEALSEAPFSAEMLLKALPGADVTIGRRSDSHAHLTRRALPRCRDRLILALPLAGRARSRQFGREAWTAPGQAVLLTTCDPGTNLQLDNGRHLNLIVDRAQIAPFVPDIDAVLSRTLAPSDALRLVAGYAQSAIGLPEEADHALGGAVARHLVELLCLALGRPGAAGEHFGGEGPRAARLRAVKADVERHLARGDLSAETVARRQRVSPDYVRKLFRGEGTSFADYVTGRRLERAHARLSDPRGPSPRVVEVAADVGLTDPSYFNRLFRRRFDATPGDVRRRALAEVGEGAPRRHPS